MVLEDLRKIQIPSSFFASLCSMHSALESTRTYYTATVLHDGPGTLSLRVGQDTAKAFLSKRKAVFVRVAGCRLYLVLRQ